MIDLMKADKWLDPIRKKLPGRRIGGEDGMSEEELFILHRKMRKVASLRTSRISKEFKAGFKFIENYPKSVTFFGSTRFKEGDRYYNDARTLGARIVNDLGYSVVTGGGPGIMEAANRGAFEAGGQSIGHLIELPDGQPINQYMSSYISYHHFFVRKVMLGFSAEAYLFYPGGYGTQDEFFEILTLIQTGKIKSVPLICVGTDYWAGLKEFMEKDMVSRGTIDESELSLFSVTDSHDYILELIKNVPVREIIPLHTAKPAGLTEEEPQPLAS
jgi:uncharacterized protein (TIGR00730 family)